MEILDKIMLNKYIVKIKKFYRYIRFYKKNRDILRILNEKETFPLYIDHYNRCVTYTNNKKDQLEKILSSLIISGHSIEKGLANKNIRYGFGQQKVKETIELIKQYKNITNIDTDRFSYVLGILDEYYQLHLNHFESLSNNTINDLKDVLTLYKDSITETKTIEVTSEDYFNFSNSSFIDFATSRHSIRDFSGKKVEETLLEKVFELAQKAPSACNRQSVHVYAIYNKEIIFKLVDLQNHQRGFADNANPLLVISYEMQDWGTGEQWFGGFLDSGIYLMNLLYSLHYYKIAAIPLNWYATIENNNKLREVLDIPDSHVPVAFVACGYPINDFKLVTSKRRTIKEIVHFVK